MAKSQGKKTNKPNPAIISEVTEAIESGYRLLGKWFDAAVSTCRISPDEPPPITVRINAGPVDPQCTLGKLRNRIRNAFNHLRQFDLDIPANDGQINPWAVGYAVVRANDTDPPVISDRLWMISLLDSYGMIYSPNCICSHVNTLIHAGWRDMEFQKYIIAPTKLFHADWLKYLKELGGVWTDSGEVRDPKDYIKKGPGVDCAATRLAMNIVAKHQELKKINAGAKVRISEDVKAYNDRHSHSLLDYSRVKEAVNRVRYWVKTGLSKK